MAIHKTMALQMTRPQRLAMPPHGLISSPAQATAA